jgi:hypothetical protein
VPSCIRNNFATYFLAWAQDMLLGSLETGLVMLMARLTGRIPLSV